jgi:hypothetical protein
MNLHVCTNKGEDLLLRDVSTFLVDAEFIRVLYNDGKQQNYPLQNVRWYGPEEPIFAPTPSLARVKKLLAFTAQPWEPGFPADSDDAHEYNVLTQHSQDQYSD